MNLVGTANGCDTLVFIVARGGNQYPAFKRMFEVIEANRMMKSEMATIVQPSQLSMVLENYGYYKLAI